LAEGTVVQINRRWIVAGAVVCVLGAFAGVWMLLHPAAFWLQPWRPEAQHFDNRIIFGPYPIEPDFLALRKQGVATIVSLLDSDLPYEKVLLGQEQELAARYGMKVLNFPMASILGQSFGKDYVAMSKAAAQAARDSPGIVYIHCYLGLHRADNVRRLLATGTALATYKGKLAPERSADTLALDRANIAFLEGRPQDTLDELEAIKEPGASSKRLGAWAHYRLGEIDAARAGFAEVAAEHPDDLDAAAGLAYCALRSGDLDEAEKQFQRVLLAKPDDAQSTEGLGYVRYRQDRKDEARALFEKVLEQHPENLEVRQILERLKAS
jgi:tetratricopeptide (TPR) repeat protein